jgi:hypothetical protein
LRISAERDLHLWQDEGSLKHEKDATFKVISKVQGINARKRLSPLKPFVLICTGKDKVM